MSYRLPSYKKSECCDADCHMDSEEQPCYGVVEVIGESSTTDEDWYWVHACEGHNHDNGGYKPSPYQEDQKNV